MSASKELFRLIKSLNQTEKRYFKIYASRHVVGEKNKYVRIFEAIEKQSRKHSGEYDEKELKQIFKGEVFIRQFHVPKNYLYHLILRSLTAYHSEKSISYQVKDIIRQVEILYEKKLFSQCKKLLVKAKELSTSFEYHLQLIEIIRWEIQLISAQGYSNIDEQDLKTLHSEINDSLHITKNANDYSSLVSEFYLTIVRKGLIRTPADINAYKKIFNHPLLQSGDKALSYSALCNYYDCKMAYYTAQLDYKNACIYSEKLVKYIESHPHQISENPRKYANTLNNFIILLFNEKKYNAVLMNIHKLEKIQTDNDELKNRIAFTVNELELLFYIETGQTSKGLSLANHIKGKLTSGEIEPPSEASALILYLNLSISYFAVEKFSEANRWINKIIHGSSGTIIRSDLHCFAKIFSLIINYEMGNRIMIEYAVKSTYRFLLKRNRIHKYENIILDFMRKKMPVINNAKELTFAFTSLKTDIEKLSQNKFEKQALEYFDLVSWLESKIQKKSFAEIVKEKAKLN